MKNKLFILLMLIFTLSIVGCSKDGNNVGLKKSTNEAEETVQSFCQTLSNGEFEKLGVYFENPELIVNDAFSEDANGQAVTLQNYLTDNAKKIEHTITDSAIDKDNGTATVTVDFKYVDGSNVIIDTFTTFISESMNQTYNNTQISEQDSEQLFNDIFTEKITNTEVTYSNATIVLNLVKTEDGYLISNPDPALLDVMYSNLISALNTLGESFMQ